MKKLFLLIPVLFFAMMAKAIAPGTKALYNAYNSAADGATIVLEAGTYDETERLIFTKSITIMAAEGAEVIVKPHKDNQINEGAKVKFIGIKFDGSEMSTYEYFIRSYDATAGKELRFEKCEMTGFTGQYLINAANAERTLDSVIINNCKCINNGKDAIYIGAGSSTQETAKGVIVKNSTFANFAALAHSVIEVDNYGSTKTPNIEVTVDHCTFYNNPTTASGYADIRVYKSTKVAISNCIFAHPEEYARCGTYCYGGTINNCLSYNLTSGTKGHRADDINLSTCLPNADPLFKDAANGDFSLANNWVTMSISPARGTATDGSDLGDPRWHSDPVLPSTNFAPSYVFLGTKAQLSGSFALNGDSYIQADGTTTDGLAVWKIKATRKCIVEVTLNIAAANTSGHRYEVALYDADNVLVGTALAEPKNAWSAGDLVLGSYEIPAAGNYTVKLTNDCDYSSTIIEGVTFAYVGGAVQSMPGTTNIADAWFSADGTRADGKIDFPDGKIQDNWVKWNVAFASAGNYNVTVNIDNVNGHNYTVALYEDEDDESPITLSEGGQKSTVGTIELGAMEVPAGNYIMKVTNATQYSDAKLVSVTFAYAGGGVIEFGKDEAGALLANADAIVSDDWSIEGGKITHADSKALTGWAKWNVDCADYGNYNVTVNISSDNGHLVRVEIFENEAESAIYTLDETSATQYHTGDQAIDLGNIVLDDREYVVKVSNTQEYSHVQIASIDITYLNGARATLPATLDADDAMFSTKAYADGGEIYFSPNPGSQNVYGEWAKWNVKAAAAGTFLFTLNVTSDNSQTYKITILDGETEVDSYEEHPSSGDQTIKHYFNLAAGNYTVKLENTYSWSHGHIVSLVVTQPSVLVIDETAENNSVIVGNYRNGNHDIKIIRTITPNMYNTICLPFDLNSSQLTAFFGSDVVLKQMSGATISGDELELNFSDATSIYRGTPYLIKTSKAVVNPVFTDIEIKTKEAAATGGEGFDADFIGSFIKTTIPASEYNLFLGSNDKLYFSNNDVTIKGMRAYFHIKDNGTGAPVRKARIVEQGNVVTELELINSEWQDIKSANGTSKTIEDGQLILIRDGKRYNVMGIRF